MKRSLTIAIDIHDKRPALCGECPVLHEDGGGGYTLCGALDQALDYDGEAKAHRRRPDCIDGAGT